MPVPRETRGAAVFLISQREPDATEAAPLSEPADLDELRIGPQDLGAHHDGQTRLPRARRMPRRGGEATPFVLNPPIRSRALSWINATTDCFPSPVNRKTSEHNRYKFRHSGPYLAGIQRTVAHGKIVQTAEEVGG